MKEAAGHRLHAFFRLAAYTGGRRGAILHQSASVRFEILEHEKRPVSAVADSVEVRGARCVEVRENRDVTLNLLFDHEHNLQERVLKEQFAS